VAVTGVDSTFRTLNEEAFAVIRASSGKTAAGRLLIGAGVLALLIPAIAGCEAGPGAPTLQFHAASAGAYADFNGITITNAFVLGAAAGSTLPSGSSAGLFVSLYNGSGSSDTLESVTAPGSAASITLSGGPVALPAESAPVNLTGPQPQVVLEKLTKPLTGGTYVPVTLEFLHAGSITLQVPVEPQSYVYATYSAAPTPAPTPTAATPTPTPVVTTPTPAKTTPKAVKTTPKANKSTKPAKPKTSALPTA
jgi:copper(I)-binding protein